MAMPVGTKPGWRFGVFEADALRGELRRAGLRIKLREQSFQILLALLENPGEIVTREELRRQLWPSDTFVDFDHSLNTAMMRLRDALGDSTDAPIYVETVPRHGYRFIAPVLPAQAPFRAPAAPQREIPAQIAEARTASQSASRVAPRFPLLAGITLGALLVLGGAAYLWFSQRHTANGIKRNTSFHVAPVTSALL